MNTDSLPEEPGCYIYRDSVGTPVYIGKAKNLKKRVSSYFTGSHDPKTNAMLGVAEDFDYIVTRSETEALILENNLIKRYQPKYNIDLRDSKNYAYIHITGGKFPRIGIARRKGDSGEYFGPFVSAKERDYVLSVVRKTFRLRSCRKLRKRACLRYHMGTCSAPCIGQISAEDYSDLVRKAVSVLKGNNSEIISSLKEEMAGLSAAREFEKAMVVRDQITAVRHLSERQHIDQRKDTDEDIINYTVRDGIMYLMLFSVYKGTLGEKKEFVFDCDEGSFGEFIIQYYAENEPPRELILPEIPDEALEDYLSSIKGMKVRVTVPQKGEKKALLDLVKKNIESVFFGGEAKVERLRKALHLTESPDVIECFDISHLSGTAMVGSMVQFRYGKPDKRNYRRFRIKAVEGIDDFASIAEVVGRRYSRLIKEEAELPDLIVIDGGKGQLSSALGELEKLDVGIPVISLAKREEEVFVPGMSSPLPLKKNDKASLFLQEIRDEAHRFAISYNRLLRSKEAFDED
ncbi:excinuclease ABC subunit UvrC [Methanolacinia paynteri]|uniref:excinuclease ABC subunit UvrC n=1 Tax=Methanolacinia paynteri TaxID=230356 RepID=UPI00064FE8F9|nr:excinuclease ABC subunit UvrC [Methanolacinia paynteri]